MNATVTLSILTGPTTYAATAFQAYFQQVANWPMPEDPDDGSAGVREPRRPLPAPPSMTMVLA